ncbi:1-deoxy-D-xylulose-5-phosphate reductoisomerase, partial [Klebsiella variicola]
MKQLTVLGSTGSIGCSTLDVVRHNPGCFSVAALVAGKNVDRMVEQCLEFTPRYAVMDDAQSAERLRIRLHEHGCRTEVLSGQQAAAEVAALDEVDQVMAAIVGAAGLVPTLAAIRAGKT